MQEVFAAHTLRINKWRVREGHPVSAQQILFLYQEVGDNNQPVVGDTKLHKFKANRAGVVKKRLLKEGEIVQKGAPLLELSECIHTTVIKDMCANCGADLRQNNNGQTSEASVPMVHTIPDLKVSQKLAQKLGLDDTRRLLADRKLVLLVDLDQTVIHTTNDAVPDNIKGIYHFQLYGPQSPWYHTRLRPGTAEFLDRMSQIYELHICTFGARNYAHMIAQLLDPKGKFFSHRILSRDECFNATSKTDNLKALFPNGDSMVCIIDDREDVWNMASNLIQVKPYHFFQHTGDINAPPGLSKHELDGEGVDFKDMDKMTEKMFEKEEQLTDIREANIQSSSIDATKSKDPDKEDNTVSSTSKDEDVIEIIKADRRSSESDSKNTDASSTTELNVSIANAIAKPNGKVAADLSVVPLSGVKTKSTRIDNSTTETKIDQSALTMDSSNLNCSEQASNFSKSATKIYKDIQADLHLVTAGKDVNLDDVPTTSKSVNTSANVKVKADGPRLIEIEDPDDYLLYLEVILRNIHKRFYAIYDETTEIPDLKIIVPKIRSEVLRGKNLVFSGLVPTQMKLEQSRAYFIAKSLGAEVQPNISKDTTHLVAVNAGTYKVNAAKRDANIRVVNANWLWTCAERWEHVEEKLFALDRKVRNKGRQPPAHCHSPEHVVNYNERSEISPSSSMQQQEQSDNFRETLNPLLVFTNADIESMNKDYENFFESDSSSDEGPVNFENPPMDKKLRKRKREDENSNRAHDFFTRSEDVIIGVSSAGDGAADFDKDSHDGDVDDLAYIDKSSNEEDDDDEVPSAKFRRGEELPSDLEMGSESNSGDNPEDEDDGEWNMMGAALEREFLGLED